MNFKTFALATVSAAGISGAASAATLVLDPTGGSALAFATYSTQGVGGYNPTPGSTAATLTEDLIVFDSSSLIFPGVTVTAPTSIRVTFLGKEAGAVNVALSMGGGIIFNTDTPDASSYQFNQLATLLNFAFNSLDIVNSFAPNGGVITGTAALGFSQVFNGGKSIYAFFDDSGAQDDRDFDDMVVRIDVVPLPASALLLLGGLGGLAAMRRRKAAA